MARDYTHTSGLAGAAVGAYKRAIPYRYRLKVWAYRQRRARLRIERRYVADAARMASYKDELAALLAGHVERKGVILFPPSVNWETPLFQRPHQLARALAELGYLVLYCVFIDSPDDVTTFREIQPNLALCRAPAEVFRGLDEAVTFSYTHNYAWVRRARARRIIYELIDRFALWPDFCLQTLRRNHRQLLSHAEVVAGVSADLRDELRLRRPDALLCPNGVDYAHFAAADEAPIPEDMRALVATGKPIIGYYGALAEWFDYGLWARTARALPEYEFVLIGPEYSVTLAQTPLHGVDNIHWLGPKPYAALPAYLRHFTVATIPFVVNETTHAVSPIKLFEYMAGGRPIVTSDLAECRAYPVALVARSPDEWIGRLREAVALREDSAYRERLDGAAREQTWHARARQLLAALAARDGFDASQQMSAEGPVLSRAQEGREAPHADDSERGRHPPGSDQDGSGHSGATALAW